MTKKFDFNSMINEEIHRIRNSNVFYTDFSSRIFEGEDLDNTSSEGAKESLLAKERIIQLLDETIDVMKTEYQNITSIENADPVHTELGAKVDVLIDFLNGQLKEIKKLKFNVG